MCCISHPKESKKNAVHVQLRFLPQQQQSCAWKQPPKSLQQLQGCSDAPAQIQGSLLKQFIFLRLVIFWSVISSLPCCRFSFSSLSGHPYLLDQALLIPGTHWILLGVLWPLQGFLNQSWLGVRFPRMDCLLRILLFVIVGVIRKEKNPTHPGGFQVMIKLDCAFPM